MEMIGVVSIFILLLFSDVESDVQRCPYGTHKKIRAKYKCFDENQYHCLLDRNRHIHIEMCTNPKYYRRGLRPVYKGNIDAEKCDVSNFSPKSIQSNENDKCPFMKSLCAEEGQLVLNNGSTETDRSCRCDYRRGYDFVIVPKNPCRCFPLDEDCSCYRKKCRDINDILTPDYSCTQGYSDSNVHQCPRITNDGNCFQSTEPTYTLKTDIKNKWELISFVLIIVCLGVLSVFIILLTVEMMKNYKVQEKETVLESNQIGCVEYVESIQQEVQQQKKENKVKTENDTESKKGLIGEYIESIQQEVQQQKKENKVTTETDTESVTESKKRLLGEYVELENQTDQRKISKGKRTMSTETIVNDSDEVPIVELENQTDQRQISKGKSTMSTETIVNDSDEVPIVNEGGVGMTCTLKTRLKIITMHEFHEISQLEQLKNAVLRPETRLIILRGPNGAGKTQTASKFCLNFKNDYFVIGQLIATTTDSFIESLNTLAQQLCLKLTPKPGDSEDEYIDSIISLLVNYFNHENRSQCSYLMLIDDFHIKTDPAHNFVEKIFEDVKKLKFVITTIEHDLPGEYPVETLHVIEFNGMSESEYLSFFKTKGLCSKESDKDITKLVETIGSLPLTLISARKYLAKHKSRIEEYLRILEQLKTSTPEIHTQWEKKSAIPLLLLSLRQIIKFLKKNYKRIAEVIMFLPYLDYKEIRTDVIEACYRHFVSAENAKLAASAIVDYFLDYSLCHYVGQDKDKLSFHTETMTALKLYDKEENRKSDYERLWFLIEMFCFEIDLDVRVDISLNRNLLFLKHAGKVIKQLEQEDSEDGSDEKILKQRRIYMCYLHYVIGKTSLFQATDIPFAHKHLMRARILCTDLVEDKSDLTKQRCRYLKGTDDIPDMKLEKVLHAFALFCAAETGPGFAQTFVCGKFRNDRDVQILQSVSSTNRRVCKSGYLSIEDYNCLSKEKLAMPLDLLSKGFLGELMMHIFFDNGRALDELMYVANEDDRQKVKIARNFEFQTCIEFTKKMSSREKFQNFPILCYLALDREEQAYKLGKQNKEHSTESLINRISHIRKIMEQGKNNHFQLGILKTEPNEREYHNCECYRLLLKYYQQLFKLSKCKETLFEGRKAEEEFEKILLQIEHDQKQYKWVEMPKFYIQCAKFLHLSKTVEDCNLSIELYQKAIDFEENRGVHLTRYLWEGYFGKAKCCLLVIKDEAQKIYDQLQKRLEGTDHNLRIQKLNELFRKN